MMPTARMVRICRHPSRVSTVTPEDEVGAIADGAVDGLGHVDEARIRGLLLNCLEDHYGSLERCIVDPDRATVALRNIQAELERVKNLL